MRRWTTPSGVRGQTLVETALVLPLFILVVSGIIVFGIGVFYQQQVTNVAREGARYVAIHSATSSDCPVGSWRDVNPGMVPIDIAADTTPCEGRGDGWPGTHTHARQYGFGLNPNDLHLTACWSGWWEGTSWDAGPTNATTLAPNDWKECSMEGGTNPISDIGSLSCPSTTVAADDQASNLATSSGVTANRVTVYACYRWTPPMAGFLGIPDEITFRAVVTEALQHQR